MNFGRILNEECVNVPGPEVDPRCGDPAYALNNPDICGQSSLLMVKPGMVVACAMGKSVQFSAFIYENGEERDVTDDCLFTSSDTSIVLVSASGGGATGLIPGEVKITATYGDKSASATMVIIAESEDCCSDQTVATMIMVDRTKSMGLGSTSGGMIRLAYAKSAAKAYIDQTATDKGDLVGLMSFDTEGYTIHSAPVADKAAVSAMVASIAQTQKITTFHDALEEAIHQLSLVSAHRKVLLLISDGEDTEPVYDDDNNPFTVVQQFKDIGGVVICLGARASGKGYTFLSLMATGGMFINAYPANSAAALTFLHGLRGYFCGGNCTDDGDYWIGKGKFNYEDFINWDVVDGCVDLQGNGFWDYLPGNGLYVDLMSGEQPAGENANGKLTLKTPLALSGGDVYRLTLNLAGNQIVDAGTYIVSVRVYWKDTNEHDILTQKILITDYQQDFKPYNFTFTAAADMDVYIQIYQDNIPLDADTRIGCLLDRVLLVNVTDGVNVFDDEFDNENLTYIPPKCGTGTYYFGSAGYVTGYHCDGYGCLDDAPPAQVQDPAQLPDIESGTNPGGTWTVTDLERCAECVNTPDHLYENAASVSSVPAMTSLTAPSGLVSYDSLRGVVVGITPPYEPWRPFAAAREEDDITSPAGNGWMSDPDEAFPHYLGYKFTAAKTIASVGLMGVSGYNVTGGANDAPTSIDFIIQGSNDGLTWSDLLEVIEGQMLNQGDHEYAEWRYTLPTPAACLYYRIYFPASTNNVTNYKANCVSVLRMNLYESVAAKACATASYTSYKSYDDAVYWAGKDAQAKADALLNCKEYWLHTATYPATCRDDSDVGSFGNPVTRSYTYKSYISADDAKDRAESEAKDLAVSALVCTLSNNTQKITINDAPNAGIGAADPYPSVKYVSAAGNVTKVTVTLTGFKHESPEDVRIALRGPDSTLVDLMSNCGGAFSVAAGINLVFDDDAGAALPDNAAITAGTYQPTRYGDVANWQGGLLGTITPEATLAAFVGRPKTGSWSLWVIDKAGLGIGEITSGWDLTIT